MNPIYELLRELAVAKMEKQGHLTPDDIIGFQFALKRRLGVEMYIETITQIFEPMIKK